MDAYNWDYSEYSDILHIHKKDHATKGSVELGWVGIFRIFQKESESTRRDKARHRRRGQRGGRPNPERPPLWRV